jgi:carbon starvation protein
MKIGTIALLVVSVCVANPTLQAPPLNEVFASGGPTFPGSVFPFVFICVMCGAISGFHSLVSAGTTPKMIDKESHIRRIGYGAMLIEGLVGTVALIAAASLPSDLYYDINVAIDKAQDPKLQQQLTDVRAKYGVTTPVEAQDPLHRANVDSPQHLDLGQVEEKVGGEALRGRTGGAVTLAVGMSLIFDNAFRWVGVTGDWLLKYWYHFAIMFEALFILTTIDAGTRVARFVLQEFVGRAWKPFARPDSIPASVVATTLIVLAWGYFIWTGSINTIWPMFGIANQLLAAVALAVGTTIIINIGRAKHAWITFVPLCFVSTTTLTAGFMSVRDNFWPMAIGANPAVRVQGYVDSICTVIMMACVVIILTSAARRWLMVLTGRIPVFEPAQGL